MPLRDQLYRAIESALEQQPEAQQALAEGPQQKRGDAADALQDLIKARNALLDAASRWDHATEAS